MAAAVQLLSKLMVVLWVLGPTALQWLVLAALVPSEVLGPLALKTWQLYQLLLVVRPPPCTLQLSAVLLVPLLPPHPCVQVVSGGCLCLRLSLCDQLTMLYE